MLLRELGSAPLWRVLWRPVLATAAMALMMLALRFAPVLAVVAGIACYVAVLALLRTFTAEDRAMVRRILGRRS